MRRFSGRFFGRGTRLIHSGGALAAAAPTAPVLANADGWTTGDNPPTWTTTYPSYIDYNPDDGTGDQARALWRIGGTGAWATEDWVPLNLGAEVTGIEWPLLGEANLSAGGLFEVYEELGRDIGLGTQVISAASNTWSDTLNAQAAPATYTHGGKATSASSSTAVSFTTRPFTAGKAVVWLTCFSNAGGTVDSAPTSLTLTPTGGGSAVTLTKLGSGGQQVGRAFAIYASATDIAAGNYDVTGTRPAAARSNVLFFGSLKGNSTPTSGPTFTTGTSEGNPHATASLTCPPSGLLLGAFVLGNSITATANSGTTVIDQIFFNSEEMFILASSATTGAISINATPNNSYSNGRAVVAFQP